MPTIVVKCTKANLERLPKPLESSQELLESHLIAALSGSMDIAGLEAPPEFIGVEWIVPQRTRNCRDYGVEVIFSEHDDVGDPGYRTNSAIRRHMQLALANVLKYTSLLPSDCSASVWIGPIHGGSYTEIQREEPVS